MKEKMGFHNWFIVLRTFQILHSQNYYPIIQLIPSQLTIILIFSMNSKNKQVFAIPFISFAEGKGFKLNQEAQQFLLSIPEKRKLAVVSIVGKYRTGKSFFVNRVLLNQKKGGFQVGPTINPCTKGLWLWKKTVQSPNDEDMDIILIDTEGFGGMDENANHDSRIFLFSLLLSSFFIYNSVGSIDQNALNTLNLVINLAKDIQSKTNNSSDDVSHFPTFLWIVRDFTLMMVDKTGQKISSKQYLQNALQFQPGNSNAIEAKNKIRRLLKHFFTQRDCQTMVRPTQKQKDLQRLDEIDNSQLRPEFVLQAEHLRKKIYSNAKPKKVNGKQLNGHLLVALCKGYMEAINKGALPNVESAWYYVCRSEGMKAIKQASNYLQSKIQQILKKPLSAAQLQKAKQILKQQVMNQFRKKSMGSEQGNPDLIQKLQNKIQQNFKQLKQKNKRIWSHKYREKTEKFSEIMRDSIFREQFEDFSQFVTKFENLKKQYNAETSEGDQEQKWTYFNQIAQQLYKLAGETITTRINKNIENEKKILEQKMALQQEALQAKSKQQAYQKNNMKNKIQQLQKSNARLQAAEETNSLRVNQYKSEYDKLYQKYKHLQNEYEQRNIQVQKVQRQIKKVNQNEVQELKNQISVLRANSQKQKALFQMEKKFMKEETTKYEQKVAFLENQIKRIKTNNSKISSEFQDMQARLQQKQSQCKSLQQSNNSYAKKIESLIAENSKKNEILGEHNEWLLEKAYLQNQVSFLKNTLNENKRLHDTLLVALQQSIASTQGDCNNQLVQANKNMSSALEKMQQRCKILQQKYQKVKNLKKIFKNCSAMQCSNCGKWIQSLSFSQHLDQCGENSISLREKTQSDLGYKDGIHISVSQNISKQTDEKKKPYLQYIIQVILDDKKWKVSKQYKQFTELSQNLLTKFPSLKFPQSFNQLIDSKTLLNNKKNAQAEQRRKNIQQCLRDLLKIEQIKQSKIMREFLEFQL